VEFPVRISEFIFSERQYCRRILKTSPVGNCPVSHLKASAPLHEVATLGAVRTAQSQVK